MKQSLFFAKTSKSVSDEDKMISARLLKQGAYIRESVAGRYFILPLGQRVQQNIMKIVKEEMDAVGAQEMLSPILHPLELWKETNRTNTAGFELMQVKDRRGGEFALGGTAEEMFVDLIRKFEISYKDLPLHLYQFSSKFRDELRARGGLLRVREFIMKDGYSFHADESDFKVVYEEMKQVYLRIFSRLGLVVSVVESDNGYIGGEYCHEFILESEAGESRYFVSEDGQYAAHEDVAKFEKVVMNADEPLKEMESAAAPRGKTMEDGVAFHGLPLWRQIKDVLFVDDQGRFILAIIRGDFDVNETKLKNLIHARDLRHATEDEIREQLHSEPGFISPVGIKEGVAKGTNLLVVADDSLRSVRNCYGGANKKDADLLNVNIDRDYQVDAEGDIALAQPGFLAIDSHGAFVEKKGIEVGNIFQLGYHYTNLMKGAVFTDRDGVAKPYYMGCYGIGIGRTLAAIVEDSHDDKGIIWPASVAPFAVHIVALSSKDESATARVWESATELYETLRSHGVEVLFDDRRDVRPGEKFADSDLMGIPLRLIISEKTLAESSVEWKGRKEAESRLVPLEEVVDAIVH